MLLDVYGIVSDGPGVTYYLWSPWRASHLEHRMFDGIRLLTSAEPVQAADEIQLMITDVTLFKKSIQLVERVLKGWQEEGTDAGGERRSWRWMLEADVDTHGYDHAGERASMWGFLRLTVEREGGAEGPPRGEDIDLNGFGFRVWRQDEKIST